MKYAAGGFGALARAARKPVNRQRLSCCDAAEPVLGHDGI